MSRLEKEEALRLLETRKIPSAPTYILEGSDEYLTSKVLQLLRESIIDSDFSDFNHTSIDCTNSTKAADLIKALRELPMLADKRLLELHRYQSLSSSTVNKIEDTFKETIKEGSCIICLISHDDIRNSKSKLKTWAQDWAQEISCSISLYAIPRWINHFLKERGCRAESRAVQELQNRSGSNLFELSVQLEQLVIYVGDKQLITVDDVCRTVHKSNEVKAWEYTEAVTSKNTPRAMQACASLLEDNAQRGSLTLLSYINTYLRSLAQIQDLTKKYGYNLKILAQHLQDKKEIQIRRSLEDLRSWREDHLRSAFQSLCQADWRLKTGASPILTMQLLTLRLTNRR
ncbi:MAG: DNA polymerase III subunit delta [Candidatus Bruticola sp.]